MKGIIFGFDGLRPDCVTQDVMPRLHAFLGENVYCKDHRSVFPTETYVAHPSIFSGFLPERHGIVANGYFDAAVSRSEFFVGSKVERIEAAEAATRGGLFRVPTLTQIAASRGLRCVTISSNTPGSTRLISHKTPTLGGVNLSVNGLRYALPQELAGEFNNGKEDGSFDIPDTEGLRRMNEVFHTLVRRAGVPDLSVIWYGEPDHSFHAYGVGAKESRNALREADRCFGEILEAHGDDQTLVVVASDHGHITIREHFDLKDALRRAGFRPGENLADEDADFVLLWGYSGNIYVLNRDLIAPIAQALMGMPEVGLVFTEDRDGVNGVVPGTFSTRLVAGDGARAGDIRFVLEQWDEADEHGYAGTCLCGPGLGIGAGVHGGLHPGELQCLLGWGGPGVKTQTAVETVTGVIDIAPTLYHLMGIEPSILPQGRVLYEVLAGGTDEPPKPEPRTFTAGRDGFAQQLTVDYVGRIPYLRRGGRLRG